MPRNAHESLLATALIAGLAAACGGQDPVIAAPLAPVQDVLMWTIDARGEQTTHWIRGNRQGGRLIGSRPGLLLALPGGVYEIETREVAVPTCDCAAWDEAEREGACPVLAEDGAAAILTGVRLADDEELAITAPPDGADEGGAPYGELESVASVVASMGPYLFIRIDTRLMACGAAHDSSTSEFLVFDLVAGRAVDLLTQEERIRILGREQAAAFKLFEGDTLARAAHPNDLELTMIAPVILPGLGVGLRYQFSAGSSFSDADGAWGGYTRSAEVLAAELPASIAPFAAIPEALYAFPCPGEGLAIGGFAPVTATAFELALLERAFTAAPEGADADSPADAVNP
jgi:hypothetical protein